MQQPEISIHPLIGRLLYITREESIGDYGFCRNVRYKA